MKNEIEQRYNDILGILTEKDSTKKIMEKYDVTWQRAEQLSTIARCWANTNREFYNSIPVKAMRVFLDAGLTKAVVINGIKMGEIKPGFFDSYTDELHNSICESLGLYRYALNHVKQIQKEF